MLTQNLSDLKRQVQTLLLEDGMGAALQELEKALPPNSPKFNVLLQLKARLHETNLKKIKHVISDEQATLQYDQLRVNLLDFLDGLQEKDFAADAAKKAKTGSVLYRIPHRMERLRETKCIVRLAFDEEVIIQNIELSADVTLQTVRVSEAMEVHLLDPRGGENFTIRTISAPEQFLEQDEYSEWLFYVTPLKTGRLPLVLKVCVLEQVAGKERKREIVLEEIITIVAEPVAEEEAAFRHGGYCLTFSEGGAVAMPFSGGAMGFVRRYSLVFAALLLAVVGAWALDVPQEFAWQWAKIQNSSESYEGYLKSYPEGRHKKKAVELRDFREAVEARSDSLLVAFLVKHPESESSDEAKALFRQRSDVNLDSLLETLQEAPAQEKQDEVSSETTRETQPTTVTPAETKPQASKPSAPATSGDVEKTQPPSVPSETEREQLVLPGNKPAEVVENTGTADDQLAIENPIAWLEKSMVKVDGGSFMMGCDAKRDGNCYNDELPLHQVKVSTFQISRYEVTQALWKAIMQKNRSLNKGCDLCPVGWVSWDDVQEFLKKLNDKTGKKYRLPTEAEWEFAARGGKKTKRYKYAGDHDLDAVASLDGKTHPVGKKKANELGLYDMSANVYELCKDVWHDNYQEAPADGKCWTKGGEQSRRVCRGGASSTFGVDVRPANRSWLEAGDFSPNHGFRVAHD